MAARQGPRTALNGGRSAAAGLHLEVFKACRGSRNTPETHEALSHVSFGRTQTPRRALNPSWSGSRAGPGADPGRTRGGPGPDPVRTRPGPGPTYVPSAMPGAAERLPGCPPTRLGTLSCAMLQCQVHSESTFWAKGAYFRRRAGIPFGPNRLQQDTRVRFVILQSAHKTPEMRSWRHVAALRNTSQSTRNPHFADALSKIRSAQVPADSAWHS